MLPINGGGGNTMKSKIVKAVAIAAIGLMSFGALAGCTKVQEPVLTQADIDAKVAEAKLAAKTDLNAVQDALADKKDLLETAKEKLIEAKDAKLALEQQAARDAQIIADYEQAMTEVEIEETVETTVCSKTLDFDWGEDMTTVLDDRDVAMLQDSQIEFDYEDYDFSEEIRLSSAFELAVSLFDDDEMGAIPHINLDSGAVEYRYVFEDTIDISDVSEDEPITINFLGVDVEIVEVTDDSFTIRHGSEYSMLEGDVVTVDEKAVKLRMVSENDKVSVLVDGVSETIEVGESDVVNGLDVYVDGIMLDDDGPDEATLIIGSGDVDVTVEVGDEIVEDAEDWVYTMSVNGGELEYLGVMYDVKSDELDDEYAPMALGSSVMLPNDFAEVMFSEVSGVDYMTVELDFYEFGSSDVDTLRVKIDSDDLIVGNEELDTAHFDGTNVYYKNEDNDEEVFNGVMTIVNDEAEFDLTWDGSVFTIGDLEISPSGDMTFLGDEEDEAESDELVLDGTDVGNEDEDVLSESGIVVVSSEKHGDNDEVVVMLPSDTPEMVVCIK